MGDYPAWVCATCGKAHGRRDANRYATWHPDTCGVCGQQAMVTEPRDFGHLRPGWTASQKEGSDG